MELISGETLGVRLKREYQIAPNGAADLFDQLLEGLKAAHKAGIVHRDLKSENILLAKDEFGNTRVYVLDFGLAKLTQPITSVGQSQSPTAIVTTPGAVLGTFGYMSPEQLTGGVVDERRVLFSVGVMVIETITGARPFDGASYHALLTNILRGSYHLPGETAEVRRLDNVLQSCLAKSSSLRFQSASQLQAELIPALRQSPPFAKSFNADNDDATAILPSQR